jgi:hypothetical protein
MNAPMLSMRWISTALLAATLRADGQGYDRILKTLEARRQRLERVCGKDVYGAECIAALTALNETAEQEATAFGMLDEPARQKVLRRRQGVQAKVAQTVLASAAVAQSSRNREDRLIAVVSGHLGPDAGESLRRVLRAVNGLAARNGGPIDLTFRPDLGQFTLTGLRNVSKRDLDDAIAPASYRGWEPQLEPSGAASRWVLRLVPR